MKALITIACLTAGNFIYQCFGGYDWSQAAERSFLGAVAIGLYRNACNRETK